MRDQMIGRVVANLSAFDVPGTLATLHPDWSVLAVVGNDLIVARECDGPDEYRDRVAECQASPRFRSVSFLSASQPLEWWRFQTKEIERPAQSFPRKAVIKFGG